MWRWADPLDGKVAEQCLAEGNLLEAARVLLASKSRDHRCCRELLLRIGPQLVDAAREALAADDLMTAAESIECAAQCAELSVAGQTLKKQIAAEVSRRRQQQEWQQERLDRARAWAGDGRLQSAIELIAPLKEDGAVEHQRLDWQCDLDRLNRYAEAFHGHLADGQFDAARTVLDKARQIAPRQPQVLCLEQQLLAARPDKPASTELPADPPAEEAPRATCADSSRLVLTGLPGHPAVLIVCRPVVLLGTPHDPHVDVPVQALLHRHHAVLLRESAGRGVKQYRLLPFHDCRVAVNGESLAAGHARILADDDAIELGSELCRWTFRQPVRDSATATLELQSTSPLVPLPGGDHTRTVVLADDRFIVGHNRETSHVVDRRLPVRAMTLTWRDGRTFVASQGGELFVSDGTDDENPDRPLQFPARISVYADDEDSTAAAFRGENVSYEMQCELQGL